MSDGVLKITGFVYLPSANREGKPVTKKVTLATYYGIPETECEDIVTRFCEINDIHQRELFCTWTREVVI